MKIFDAGLKETWAVLEKHIINLFWPNFFVLNCRRATSSCNPSPAPSVASSRNHNHTVPSQTPPVDRSQNQTCEGHDEDDAYSQQFDTLSLGTPVRRRQQGFIFF